LSFSVNTIILFSRYDRWLQSGEAISRRRDLKEVKFASLWLIIRNEERRECGLLKKG
jgi:hypothetical protein